MPLELVTIPCLEDNYVFLLHDSISGETALIDAPVAEAVLEALEQKKWQLSEIWLTHHHWDHVDGVADLKEATGAKVIGASADAQRLPPLNAEVKPGDTFQFAGHDVHVIDVPGHTVGHVAFHVPAANAVFTGDSLMALGCGRLFEGSAAQMWGSLGRLVGLGGDTIVCSGHEYAVSNAKFALTIDPDNSELRARVEEIERRRAANQPTVPSLLSDELATNPFLRAHDAALRKNLGMIDAADVEVFAEIRSRKDRF